MQTGKFDRIALILIVALGIILFLVWSRFPDYKAFSQGDPYLDANQYLPGKNLAERGFNKEHFLAEYAIGPEECYPLWYTHNPSFSEILSGFYYRAGLREISQQRIIAILWNLLGAWFFYLLLKRLTGSLVALFSLAVFISSPLYIAWGDNLFTNHQWCFAFASMYFFLKSADSTQCKELSGPEGPQLREGKPGPDNRRWTGKPDKPLRVKKLLPQNLLKFQSAKFFLGAAAFFFFLLCYSNYEYVPFVFLFFIGLKLFKIRQFTWPRIFPMLGAGLSAIIIHQLCVIRAVGLNYWLLDKAEALFHRTGMGMTSLMEIYNKIPLLMWEDRAKLHGGFVLSTYLEDIYFHLENLYGWGWAIGLIAVCVFKRVLLPGNSTQREKIFRSIILFFIMSGFWFITFAQHTADHRWGSTILLFGPFVAFLFGSMLAGAGTNLLRKKPGDDVQRRPTSKERIILGIMVIILVLGGLIFGRVRTFRPFKAYPGIDALKKYRGAYFLTSSIPTLVSACTGTPTGWLSGKSPAQMLFQVRYLINPDCKLIFEPEYFFSPQHPEFPDFARPVDTWLSANYEIEEKGEDFTIYNLKEPLKPKSIKVIDRQRIEDIQKNLTKAIPARLEKDKKVHSYHHPPPVREAGAGAAEWIGRKILEATGFVIPSKLETGGEPVSVQPLSNNLFSTSCPLDSSSFFKGKHPTENLFNPDPAQFWHISLDKIGEPAWITIDFGKNRGEIVNFIRSKPRPDLPRQTFQHAVIQGSSDGHTWVDITAIIQEEIPSSKDWAGWFFTNDTPYRFYRLFIISGHEEDGAFFSLGALEMYHVKKLNLNKISKDVQL
jgi:hypothetical protein